MKLCDKCGAKNATRAQFCSTCGEKFRITDAESLSSFSKFDAEKSSKQSVRAKKTFDAEDDVSERSARSPRNAAVRTDRSVPAKIYAPVEHNDDVGRAAANFGVSFAKLMLTLVKGLGRLLAPVGLWIADRIKTTIVRALEPSSEWDPTRPPNFLYWALIQFLVFQLPFAIVGIVYSTLANTAREEQDYSVARRRAETAKNWLLFDFVVGIVVSVFKTLVLKGGTGGLW